MNSKKAGFFHHMKSSTHIWWQRPQIHAEEDEEQERKATWLELFFDLIYVAVIAELSHKLSTHITWAGLFEYTILFIPMWWTWNSSTFYNERFEMNDVRHRLFTFLKMIPIAAMAYSIHHAFHETSHIYIWSYIIFRMIIIYMWFSAGRANDALTQKMTNRFCIGSGISVGFWIGSDFVPMPTRVILWGIGLVIDVLTPLTTLKFQAQLPKISKSHLPERFGLFMILAIAETVIGVLAGASEIHHMAMINGLVAVFGLVLAFAIWWVYFDHIMTRPYKEGVWMILGWCYLHLPLTIGITAIGAATIDLVAHEGEVLTTSVRWLMCGSVAFVLLMMALLGLTAEIHSHQKKLTFHESINQQYFVVKTIAAIVVLGIAAFGIALSPLGLLLLLVFIMISQAVHSLYLWVHAQTT